MEIPKEYQSEIEHLKKSGIPRCIYCKKDYVKIESGKFHSTWKPQCDCIKADIRISIG